LKLELIARAGAGSLKGPTSPARARDASDAEEEEEES
jgi:hypothetical protein